MFNELHCLSAVVTKSNTLNSAIVKYDWNADSKSLAKLYISIPMPTSWVRNLPWIYRQGQQKINHQIGKFFKWFWIFLARWLHLVDELVTSSVSNNFHKRVIDICHSNSFFCVDRAISSKIPFPSNCGTKLLYSPQVAKLRKWLRHTQNCENRAIMSFLNQNYHLLGPSCAWHTLQFHFEDFFRALLLPLMTCMKNPPNKSEEGLFKRIFYLKISN